MFSASSYRSRPVVTRVTRAAAVLLAAFAMATLLASCNEEEGLLPGDDAEQIIANLESVEALSTSGQCDEAEAAIDEVAAQVEALPGSVSDRLRSNLLDGVSRLRQVVAENCPDQGDAEDDDAEADAEEADDADAEEADDAEGEDSDAPETGDGDQDGGVGPPEREGNGGDQRNQGEGNQGERNQGGEGSGPPQPSRGDSREGSGGPQAPEATPTPDESGGVSPGQFSFLDEVTQ